MSELFTQWLHAVIYTGIMCSMALLLTPEGRVKKALSVICAVAMCAAIVSPIADIDFEAYSKAMAKCKIDAEKYTAQGEQNSKNLNRTIIEDECRAYILDKADELNAQLSDVSVTAAWSTDGYWYPNEVSIVSSADETQNSKLADCISAELGVSIDNQDWSTGANDG